jgi:hypothetical protein
LHFILSLAIENYSQNLKGQIEDLAIDISQLQSFSKIDKIHDIFAIQDNVIDKVEDLMRQSLSKDTLDLDLLFANFFDLVLMS